MIYSLILLQYIKGRANHLSYVDRRTDVFCLVNKWNCMRPIVARLNPVVNEHYVIVTTLYQHSVKAD